MTVNLEPIQQASSSTRPARQVRGPGVAAVRRHRPDLNYIFWSPTNINSLFSINMARNNDPKMQAA